MVKKVAYYFGKLTKILLKISLEIIFVLFSFTDIGSIWLQTSMKLQKWFLSVSIT